MKVSALSSRVFDRGPVVPASQEPSERTAWTVSPRQQWLRALGRTAPQENL